MQPPIKNNYSRSSSPWSRKCTRTAFKHKTMYSKRLQCSPLELSLCVTTILKLKTCPHHRNFSSSAVHQLLAQFIDTLSAYSLEASKATRRIISNSEKFCSYLITKPNMHGSEEKNKSINHPLVTKSKKKAGKMLDTMAHRTLWIKSSWDSLHICSNWLPLEPWHALVCLPLGIFCFKIHIVSKGSMLIITQENAKQTVPLSQRLYAQRQTRQTTKSKDTWSPYVGGPDIRGQDTPQ